MVKLLILADDFTGALDTGVQFSSGGIKTKVIVSSHPNIGENEKYQVLVIDVETRHLTAEAAYRVVHEIVTEAVKAGVPYIYKKTDSALRGNIGSELTAALDASDVDVLPFIPAFPQMNRITCEGIHYINGVPVSQSVFGRDPFEPVEKDAVRDIIRMQSQAAVTVVSEKEKEAGTNRKGIVVFDAQTEESLEETALLLKQKGLCRLMAGCAGLAAILPQLLEFEKAECCEEKLNRSLIVVCGSVNPITRAQLAYGKRCGFHKVNLAPNQKLDDKWWESADGTELIRSITEMAEAGRCCIIDSNDPDGSDATAVYAADQRITFSEVRVRISKTLGKAARKLLEQNPRATFLITGGDTLLGLMDQIGSRELDPICEIVPGSVLTRLTWKQNTYHIITKSGGFGEENLLDQIQKRLTM